MTNYTLNDLYTGAVSRRDFCDQMINKVIMQGFKSSQKEEDSDSPRCVYHGELERKCLVGHAITSHQYTSNIEGYDAADLMKASGSTFVEGYWNNYNEETREEFSEFLLAFQIVHDTTVATEGPEFIKQLRSKYNDFKAKWLT